MEITEKMFPITKKTANIYSHLPFDYKELCDLTKDCKTESEKMLRVAIIYTKLSSRALLDRLGESNPEQVHREVEAGHFLDDQDKECPIKICMEFYAEMKDAVVRNKHTTHQKPSIRDMIS